MDKFWHFVQYFWRVKHIFPPTCILFCPIFDVKLYAREKIACHRAESNFMPSFFYKNADFILLRERHYPLQRQYSPCVFVISHIPYCKIFLEFIIVCTSKPSSSLLFTNSIRLFWLMPSYKDRCVLSLFHINCLWDNSQSCVNGLLNCSPFVKERRNKGNEFNEHCVDWITKTSKTW